MFLTFFDFVTQMLLLPKKFEQGRQIYTWNVGLSMVRTKNYPIREVWDARTKGISVLTDSLLFTPVLMTFLELRVSLASYMCSISSARLVLMKENP